MLPGNPEQRIEQVRGALAQARQPFEESLLFRPVSLNREMSLFNMNSHGLSVPQIAALEPGFLSEGSFTPFYPHEFYRFIGNLCGTMGGPRIEDTEMLLNPPHSDIPTLPILYRNTQEGGEFLAMVGTWPTDKVIYTARIERDIENGRWKMISPKEDSEDRYVIADRTSQRDLLEAVAFTQTFRNALDATNLRGALESHIITPLRYSEGIHRGPFARKLTRAEYYSEMKAIYDTLVAVDTDIYPPRKPN